MTRSTGFIAMIAALLLAQLATPANAAVQSHTTEADFVANASSIETRTFSGIVNPNVGFYIIQQQDRPFSLPSLSGGPTIFIDSNATANNVIVYQGTGNVNGAFDQDFFQSQNAGPTNTISISVPTGVSALGFLYGSTSTPSSPFSVTVIGSGGLQNPLFELTSLQLPATTLTPAFLGFTSTSGAITSVLFSANDVAHLNLLQVSVGIAAPVPEPSQYLMFAVGLALFGAVARRKAV